MYVHMLMFVYVYYIHLYMMMFFVVGKPLFQAIVKLLTSKICLLSVIKQLYIYICLFRVVNLTLLLHISVNHSHFYNCVVLL